MRGAPLSVDEIVAWTGGRVANSGALEGGRLAAIRVKRPAPLGETGPDELGFFFAREYERELPAARAGVLVTGEPFVKPLEASGLPLWKTSAVVACADPYLAMAILSEKFAERLSTVAHLPGAVKGATEIHPTAIVHPTAEIGGAARIGAHCVIEERAKIGAGTVLYPQCYVGPGAKLGRDCVLFAGVKLYEWTELGDRVRIHAGSTIGSDGFGYAPKKSGGKVAGHQKIYHLGRVVVGDDVEIGALVSIDRSTFGDTVIAREAKLDNQVHVGHNARIDEGAIVCGGTCLAGRASIGKFAYVGGLTGIVNNVHVGDGAQVGALALVTKDVPPGSTAVGNPQREYREHFRAHAALNKLADRKKGAPKNASDE
jgi:UDP-3-O-[3-hydroxymyristoyl] glucosamine N-acyltransferase